MLDEESGIGTICYTSSCTQGPGDLLELLEAASCTGIMGRGDERKEGINQDGTDRHVQQKQEQQQQQSRVIHEHVRKAKWAF